MRTSTLISNQPSQLYTNRLTRFFTVKNFLLLLSLLVFSQNSIAQSCPTSNYPTTVSAGSCTSKDLELLGAYLQGSDSCNPSEGPKKLYLIIRNKTGSTRTSFAVWGKLYVNNVLSPNTFYACVGPVRPNSTDTLLSCSELIYNTGTQFKIKNLFLAWTSASPNQTCDVLAANPNLIAPKCGTLDSLVIYTGVSSSTSSTRATCPNNKGTITVTPVGGKAPPYTAAVYNEGGKVDSSNGTFSGEKTFSNLAAGTYTVKVYDTRGCGFDKSETILDPLQPAAPSVCKTEPTLCGSEFGTVVVTDSNASYTYYVITNSGTTTNGTATFSLPAGSNPRVYYTNGSAAACVSDTASCPSGICTPSIAPTSTSANGTAKQVAQEQTKKTNMLGASDLEAPVTIKTIPNPFNNKVRFMINVAEAGHGTLEIFNIQGQKIRTLYQGYIPAGTNFYDLTVSSVRRAELIYVFTQNGVKTSGKLLQIAKD